MAKLTHDQIVQEVESRGYTLVNDDNYSNMSSRIVVKCEKGHLIETCLADFRRASFTCPVCDKSINFVNPREVPEKQDGVYRLIAFDQATEKFGLSIWDDGKLVFQHLYNFRGDMMGRISKIRSFIQTIVINQWKPDFIVMEDIQYQSGLVTFKILAMLLGVVQQVCRENDIEYEVVSPNVWRKYAGTCGKDRRQEKLLSIALVKEKFNITVGDDVAEAILIGSYGVRMHNPKKWSFGGK